MASDAASWAEIISLLSLSSALSFYLGSQLTASKTLPHIHINPSPSAPHPSPPVSASPRSAGAVGRTSAGESAGKQEKGENPWVVSEGDRKYELGDVKRIALTIDELLLLAGTGRPLFCLSFAPIPHDEMVHQCRPCSAPP
jgi:hypothetical protein